MAGLIDTIAASLGDKADPDAVRTLSIIPTG